jgi:flagellar hook-basal body complex protein FliE
MSLSETTVDATQQCSNNSANIQELSISNIRGDGCMLDINNISQTANISTSLECVNSQEFEAELKNKVKKVMEQQAKAATEGMAMMTSNASTTRNITRLTNIVKNDLNIKQLAQCIKDDYNKQSLNISNINMDCTKLPPKYAKINVKNIRQALISKSVAKCLNEQSGVQKNIQELDEKAKQVADSKATGITGSAFLGSSGSSGSCFCSLMIVVAIIAMKQGSASE